MERFWADRFLSLGWTLGFTQGFGDFTDKAAGPLQDSLRDTIIDELTRTQKECESVGLRVSVIHLEETITQLSSREPVTRKEVSVIANELQNTIRREMKSIHFFRLSPETQNYFDATGFGKSVSDAFPSTEYDIKEAGNCIALSRATACVYHSMRVLEHGLCALADRFNIPFENKSWNDVIEPIEKAIRQIKNQTEKPPNWKEDEQFYSEAAAQFMHFKNSWRNYTAHRQFKYTETEAESIFRHVRDFMRHISKRLKEKKN